MKRLLLLALSLLCLTACASLPEETQESGRPAQILHHESTSLTLGSVQQDLWDAVKEFLRENPSFRSAYRQGTSCKLLSQCLWFYYPLKLHYSQTNLNSISINFIVLLPS